MQIPSPIFPGDYSRVQLQFEDGELERDDFTFEVVNPNGGPVGGHEISLSKQKSYDPNSPEIMLLTGWKTGDFQLNAKLDGQLAGSESFTVSSQTPFSEDGPGIWIENTKSQPLGPNELGDSSTVHDDNRLKDVTDDGTRDVLVAFFQFEYLKWDQPGEPDFFDTRNNWRIHLKGGAERNDTSLPDTSVKNYLNEISKGKTDLDFTLVDKPFTIPAPVGVYRGKNVDAWENYNWWAFHNGIASSNDISQMVTELVDNPAKGQNATDYDPLEYDHLIYVLKDLEPDYTCQGTQNDEIPCNGIDDDCDGDFDEYDKELANADEACDDYFDDKEAEPNTCGNGVVEVVKENGNITYSEACDDGNTDAWDWCDSDCTRPGHRAHLPVTRSRTLRGEGFDGEKRMNIVIGTSDTVKIGGYLDEPLYANMAHENIHALQPPYSPLSEDLYPDLGASVLTPSRWDLMSNAVNLPYTNSKFSSEFGWIDKSNIWADTAYTPPAQESDSDTIMLRPLGTDSESSDTYLSAQILLGSGNYLYIEYRQGQDGHVGDRASPKGMGQPLPQQPQAGKIAIWEYRRDPASDEYNSFRRVITRPQDVNGEGIWPISEGTKTQIPLSANDTNTLEIKFVQEKLHTNGNNVAEVKINRGSFAADPSIRNYPSKWGSWKSPDIRVTNSKSDAWKKERDAKCNSDPNADICDDTNPFLNRFVPGGGNVEIHATVRNKGDYGARDVKVSAYTATFTPDGGDANNNLDWDLVLDGTKNIDLPANEHDGKEVSFDWPVQKSAKHECVWIKLKWLGGEEPSHTHNNTAKSNFYPVKSGSNSPARRGVAEFELTNPYDKPTIGLLHMTQTHPDFRSFLEHQWVTLDGGETRTVKMMYEYARDFEAFHAEHPDSRPRNHVNISSNFLNPNQQFSDGTHGREQSGGLTVHVRAGFRSKVKVEPFSEDSEYLFVEAERPDGTEIPEGPIWVRVERQDGSFAHYSGYAQAGGVPISVNLEDWAEVQVQYLGAHPYVWSEPKTFTR